MTSGHDDVDRRRREVSLEGPGPGEELVAHLAGVLDGLDALPRAPGADRPGAGPAELVALFDAQAGSRWLDVAARRMRALDEGFYTIGSAGHEANAAVGLATRPSDPALLHYRSGGLYLARSARAGRSLRAGALDVALGLAASRDDPIAGGRHKVFGSPDLAVIPQTSTIASHLPRALGIAWTLGRQRHLPARLRLPLRWPDDALVVASFGDASANHSTATGAVNAACWTARRGIDLPLLLACEDNGIGISVPTPPGWIAAAFDGRAGLDYRYDDGRDPLETLRVAPLAPRTPEAVASRAGRVAPDDERARVHGAQLPEAEGPLMLAQSINRALADVAAAEPGLVLLGEDVGRKGGVYGVTRGLQRRLGASRVVDTLLDEQTVLGLALGAGVSGLLPVPEIQYLAYLHNAEDQLRGEAATLQFFSNGAYRSPLVVRVQGLAYQRGFGGHFHNDNGLGVLRDVPGLVVACPAHPREAPALLRTCLAAAAVDGTVSVVAEPIALYHERDLHGPGGGRWLAPYAPPATAQHVPIGRAATWGTAGDLTIATFGNGLRMSLRVAARLRAEGVRVGVVDLRWLVPLPVEDVVREASATGRLLVVDETRRSGGVSEGLIAGVLEAGYTGRLARVAADDSLVPLGAAAPLVLVSEADVEDAARLLLA